jgi:dolichol-phosphate mannosyltransferase
MLLSVVIPVHNEQENITPTVEDVTQKLSEAQIPFELVLVNDCSSDGSWEVLQNLKDKDERITLVQRSSPPGFGRAIRSGIEASRGEAVTMVMADSSDDSKDIVKYYNKLQEGYDCVFGSRFTKHSVVEGYPPVKLFVNRLVNRALQVLFLTSHNDLTNAFKMYRRDVIDACGPYQSCHFNITLELSLSALIRQYNIGSVPIHWYGRKWGESKLSLWKMGRKYLSVIVKAFCEKLLIVDDLLAEKVKSTQKRQDLMDELEERIVALEEQVSNINQKKSESPNL